MQVLFGSLIWNPTELNTATDAGVGEEDATAFIIIIIIN